ncbi:bifunctional 2',3'-cyclic-nucleotide 2'-phosphodiesterase/3'-nucleotidase [Pleomorphomonas koreensis]|uniref:bifunctional 2',3'-cyclic-nucleotide 2'-phosphodiesterase/3'-nucleotidase n=1 Tax=Pleomorphomonas koreensis TaxID=257440 RepID=UPI00041A9D62|nr:bifunctional 2',3'-cyclic-nucleotide 2'-phosphodiesterase/3'-nucleotidase [Pleomorphomonas koreensis]
MPIHRLSRRDLLLATAAGALATFAPRFALAAEPAIRLRLMATSDLHVNVYPYDYYRDKADDTVGLAKTAALIAAARDEVRNTILFDNGDLIQGSPLGDYVAYEKGIPEGAKHPIVAAMNGLGYLCGTLGNHEFNYGLDFLGKALAGAEFPVVCANVLKTDGTPLVEPTRVFDAKVTDSTGAEHVLRIGVIGFVPPQIAEWDKDHLDGKATTIDIVDAAGKYLPELRQQSDVVVALCHSGIAGGERAGREENAALFLSRVPGIDVIFTGHQHLVFPGKDFAGIDGADIDKGTLNGVPAVMPGFWGSHLGVIDLDLAKAGDGWKVSGFRVEARPIYERTADKKIFAKVDAVPAVLAAVKDDHEATLDYVRRPVGETSAAISSYWALVADDPSVQIVSQAQLWYGARQARAAGLPDLPILSAAAPFKCGGRSGPDYYTFVPKGPIAIKNVADIYLYPNTIRIVKVTGEQVREWLERSAGIFNRIDPTRTDEQALIDTSFPSYNYDVIDGVTYRIDVTEAKRYDNDGKLVAPDAHRIVDLAYKGKPVEPGQEFLVVTNNYRAGGGGHFPGADGSTVVFQGPDTNRDVIVRYIVENKTIDPSADGNWSIAKLPDGVNLVFPDSPNATLDTVPAGVTVEKVGDAGEGFAKYRLRVG